MPHCHKQSGCSVQRQPRNPHLLFTAAEAMGTIFTLSTISTSSIEEVAAAAPNAIKWFQLYVLKNR